MKEYIDEVEKLRMRAIDNASVTRKAASIVGFLEAELYDVGEDISADHNKTLVVQHYNKLVAEANEILKLYVDEINDRADRMYIALERLKQKMEQED